MLSTPVKTNEHSRNSRMLRAMRGASASCPASAASACPFSASARPCGVVRSAAMPLLAEIDVELEYMAGSAPKGGGADRSAQLCRPAEQSGFPAGRSLFALPQLVAALLRPVSVVDRVPRPGRPGRGCGVRQVPQGEAAYAGLGDPVEAEDPGRVLDLPGADGAGRQAH